MTGAPRSSSPAVTRTMQGNRRRDTAPEVRLRSALHARGHRFRKDLRVVADGVAVRPDVVFPRRRVAIFLDGCFWHACPEHGTQPRSNDWYWAPKLARNVERDRRQTSALERAGWRVLRVWEHEPVDQAVARAEELLLAARAALAEARA